MAARSAWTCEPTSCSTSGEPNRSGVVRPRRQVLWHRWTLRRAEQSGCGTANRARRSRSRRFRPRRRRPAAIVHPPNGLAVAENPVPTPTARPVVLMSKVMGKVSARQLANQPRNALLAFMQPSQMPTGGVGLRRRTGRASSCPLPPEACSPRSRSRRLCKASLTAVFRLVPRLPANSAARRCRSRPGRTLKLSLSGMSGTRPQALQSAMQSSTASWHAAFVVLASAPS